LRLQQEYLGRTHPETFRSHNKLALINYQQGFYIKAIVNYFEIILIKNDPVNLNESYFEEAFLYTNSIHEILQLDENYPVHQADTFTTHSSHEQLYTDKNKDNKHPRNLIYEFYKELYGSLNEPSKIKWGYFQAPIFEKLINIFYNQKESSAQISVMKEILEWRKKQPYQEQNVQSCLNRIQVLKRRALSINDLNRG
jgi:hypothetical protein